MKHIKQILIVSFLILSSCTPTVRKTVKPDEGLRATDKKGSETPHVVKDVIAAAESTSPSEINDFHWQTRDEKPGGVFVDIIFEYNSFAVSENSSLLLRKISEHLQKKSEIKLVIGGHCDERGSDEYNLALGEKRANAVEEYLAGLGVSKKRMTTISYGEERPKNTGKTDAAWAENRRVQFEVVK
jgi:peptidoglycan-associated lipoprotein